MTTEYPYATTVEYRVRPVTRYIVTKYTALQLAPGCGEVGSSVLGTFDNEALASLAAKAFSTIDPMVNRVVYEPHEEPPSNRPDEGALVGGEDSRLHRAMTR